MMKRDTIAVADIYVPIKRRATLEPKRVDEIAASILDKGLQAPILARADGARFVVVEGLHRLEAAKALGEKTIVCILVDAGSTERLGAIIRSRGVANPLHLACEPWTGLAVDAPNPY